MKSYSLETLFTFGIYEGKTVKEVVGINTSYINWCILNLDHFYLSQKSIQEIREHSSSFVVSDEEKSKLAEKLKTWEEEQDSEYDYEPPQSYEDWLSDEFGDDAETAYWNLD